MRTVVTLMMAGGLMAGCSSVQHEASTREPLAGVEIARDVSILRGTFVSGAQPDGNTVLLRGPEGLVVVDTGRHARHTGQIVEAARISDSPVVAIVNTHWHLDHVAGNALLRDRFPAAEVYASDAIDDALHGFLADYRAQLVEMLASPEAAGDNAAATFRAEIARIDSGDRLRPTQVVTTAQDRMLAGRPVHVRLERNAVSGGDVWVLDRATQILVAGDLVTLPAPLFDTACASGWQQALHRFDAMDFKLLVPGHGAPMTHTGFSVYRNAYDRLLECAASDATLASCRDGWLRDAGELIPEQDMALASNLLDYYIGQILRAPPARRGKYCVAPTP